VRTPDRGTGSELRILPVRRGEQPDRRISRTQEQRLRVYGRGIAAAGRSAVSPPTRRQRSGEVSSAVVVVVGGVPVVGGVFAALRSMGPVGLRVEPVHRSLGSLLAHRFTFGGGPVAGLDQGRPVTGALVRVAACPIALDLACRISPSGAILWRATHTRGPNLPPEWSRCAISGASGEIKWGQDLRRLTYATGSIMHT